jgi:hypothetical protein
MNNPLNKTAAYLDVLIEDEGGLDIIRVRTK